MCYKVHVCWNLYSLEHDIHWRTCTGWRSARCWSACLPPGSLPLDRIYWGRMCMVGSRMRVSAQGRGSCSVVTISVWDIWIPSGSHAADVRACQVCVRRHRRHHQHHHPHHKHQHQDHIKIMIIIIIMIIIVVVVLLLLLRLLLVCSSRSSPSSPSRHPFAAAHHRHHPLPLICPHTSLMHVRHADQLHCSRQKRSAAWTT